MNKTNFRKYGFMIGGIGLALFLLIQLIPYGRNITNPPILREPDWNSPQTREMVKKACFDCHSNETTHPWYSYVAPASWLLQYDVDKARKAMNFSEWDTYSLSAAYISQIILRGDMPPVRYLLMHPEARYTQEEKMILIKGIQESIK